MQRGTAAFRDIARGDHRHVAVVAHGRLLVVTLKALLGVPPEQPPYSLQNGSITRLQANGDGKFELLALDQVDHLADVGLGSSGDL